MADDRMQIVRDCYRAYETGDRSLIEPHLADDFTFFSGPDPGLDRATYWERCWPSAGTTERFAFVRLFERDDEVFVTYEATRNGGDRFRNTEVFSFDGDRIRRVEVYFGWDVDS